MISLSKTSMCFLVGGGGGGEEDWIQIHSSWYRYLLISFLLVPTDCVSMNCVSTNCMTTNCVPRAVNSVFLEPDIGQRGMRRK